MRFLLRISPNPLDVLFFFEFFYFLIGAFLFFKFPPDPPDVHDAHFLERRELPSALVRAVVAPWDLAVSKFPVILDRYSRFSDVHFDS